MNGYSRKAQSKYFWNYYNAAEELWKEVQQKCHQRIKQLGYWDSILGLYDGCWLHRGYSSQHGSGAIVDVKSGMILWRGDKSKDKSKFDRPPHAMSSGFMEVVGYINLLSICWHRTPTTVLRHRIVICAGGRAHLNRVGCYLPIRRGY